MPVALDDLYAAIVAEIRRLRSAVRGAIEEQAVDNLNAVVR
jgi:hypothetical protein